MGNILEEMATTLNQLLIIPMPLTSFFIADPNKPPPKMKEVSEEGDNDAKKGKGKGKGKGKKSKKPVEEEEEKEEASVGKEEEMEVEEKENKKRRVEKKIEKNGMISDSDE